VIYTVFYREMRDPRRASGAARSRSRAPSFAIAIQYKYMGVLDLIYTRLFRILYMVHPAYDATRAPASSRRRARDVAIDCDCDDREIAADDGRRCANRRGEATDATRPRRIVTSRGFDVGRAQRDANDGRTPGDGCANDFKASR